MTKSSTLRTAIRAIICGAPATGLAARDVECPALASPTSCYNSTAAVQEASFAGALRESSLVLGPSWGSSLRRAHMFALLAASTLTLGHGVSPCGFGGRRERLQLPAVDVLLGARLDKDTTYYYLLVYTTCTPCTTIGLFRKFRLDLPTCFDVLAVRSEVQTQG